MTHEEVLELVDRALLVMEAAGLHLHGRKITPLTGQAYMAAIAHRRLSPQWILPTAEWFACYGDEYPTANQFCEQMQRLSEYASPPPVVADSVLALPPSEPRPVEEVRARMRNLFASGRRRSEMRRIAAHMDES